MLSVTISIDFSAGKRLMIYKARFPSHYLPAVSDKAGWQGFEQKLPAVAFNEGCRFIVNFSVCLHSFTCDCLPPLRPPAFRVVPSYLKIVDLACFGVMKRGQVGPSEKETYQQSTQTLLFGLVCTLPLLGWLTRDPGRKAEIKIF